MDSYLKMMKHMADLYRQYEKQMVDVADDTSDFAAFIEGLDEPRFHRMMAGVPTLFGAAADPLFRYTFGLKDLKRLTGSDNRWDEVLAVTKDMPPAMDLTDPVQERQAFETADKLLGLYPVEEELCRVDSRIVTEQRQYPVILHLASKLALSKMSLRSIATPVFASFIVAMYNEHNRIRTNVENPAGENFLRRKLLQLEWLFDGEVDKKWELVFVDDGCPENSGEIAEEIIRQEKYSNARVLFLAEGIAESTPVTRGLSFTDDSQKGGAIQYGMWSVIQEQHDDARHVVIFTDSDLSTNIAQAGLLLRQLENRDRVCAVGTRYSPGGIYCTPKGAMGLTDHDHLMLVFRHFIRSKLLPQIGEIIDTQCGFKAFKTEILKKILGQMTDKRFSFDMELLLLTALQCESGDNFIGEAPIVWIESNEESNFYTAKLK
ncbi:MAG: glycosyltransferase [Deltaproteobacteria bacterium]|nr:glycosyltransferase [Deltaproteobacteria bacterium]